MLEEKIRCGIIVMEDETEEEADAEKEETDADSEETEDENIEEETSGTDGDSEI